MAISFNGEIYNYLEIKAPLEAAGAVFKGASDTEVLLAALAYKGTAILDRLDGMFAFGFWKAKERRLILAPDIFGEKPLYYAQTKDFFAFTSELQALREVPGLALEPDRHRIEVYLGLRYLPAPLSIYKQVSKLPPASVLTLSPDGSIAIEPYYRFTASSAQASGRSMDSLADELGAILEETVRSRLLTADVPVGAFLSSGVDSSLDRGFGHEAHEQAREDLFYRISGRS
jgi:asparagine synthase (glutamine-hydrolysing)